jgi:hypothetical protein
VGGWMDGWVGGWVSNYWMSSFLSCEFYVCLFGRSQFHISFSTLLNQYPKNNKALNEILKTKGAKWKKKIHLALFVFRILFLNLIEDFILFLKTILF